MYEMRRSRIARAILDYLRKHPEAQDTLAGIAEWWVPDEKLKARTTVVREALTQLVDEGLVLQYEGKDSQTHYRVNSERVKDIM